MTEGRTRKPARWLVVYLPEKETFGKPYSLGSSLPDLYANGADSVHYYA